MPSLNRLTRSGLALTGLLLLSGALTWLGVGWLGNQSLPTAVIAVVLVELLLASLGVIAILLTERITVSLLNWEKHPSRVKQISRKREPVWIRASEVSLPEPSDPHVDETPEWTPTIRFPDAPRSDGSRAFVHRRPAA